MRQLTEILRYAAEAPKGDPVPITKSEIPALSAFIQESSRNHGPLKLGESIKLALTEGRYTVNKHRVVVL